MVGSVRPLRRCALEVLILAIGILVILSGARGYMNQSMDVVLLAPPGPFPIGASVPVTVEVFNYGAVADAASVSVYVNYGTSSQRPLAVTHTGTGTYQATLVIAPGDVTGGWVGLSAIATIGSVTANAAGILPIAGADVVVRPSVTQALPGQTIDLVISVQLNGTAADASSLLIHANIASANVNTFQTLASTRTGVGSYAASYTVPASVQEPECLGFQVQATVGSFSVLNESFVLVSLPQRAFVWQHTTAANGTQAVVDLNVANATGFPLVGAPVVFRYEYPLASNTTPTLVVKYANGTTGANGLLVVNLAYAGAQTFISFTGTVAVAGTLQGFEGTVNPFPLSGSSGFVVTLVGPASFTPPSGPTVTYVFTATNNGTALASQTIYYVASEALHTDVANSVVGNGVAVTDSAGNFSITLPLSTQGRVFDFATQIGGAWQQTTYEYPTTHWIDLQVSPMVLGGVLRVTGTLPATGEPWLGTAFLYGQNASNPYSFGPGSWQRVAEVGGFEDLFLPSGNTVQYGLVIPTFLPRTATYVLELMFSPQGEYATFWDAYVFATTLHVAASAPVAAASLSPTNLSVGQTLTVNASSSADTGATITDYDITWGDGSSTGWSANTVARHAYAQAGNYTVTVSVRDSAGDMSNATYAVHVASAGPSGTGGAPNGNLLWVGVAVVLVAAGALVAFAIVRRRRRPPAPETQTPSNESPPPQG